MPMLRLNTIVGQLDDPGLAERLHDLRHAGAVETITLEPGDRLRKRLRVSTDQGTDCAVALARSEQLEDGSILLLSESRAIVVRLSALRWLDLAPRDLPAALELGYFAGNLHWRIAFAGPRLRVALEGPEKAYRERLAPYLDDGRVRIVEA